MSIAPVCKEPPAARARRLRHQSKNTGKSAWIWGTVTRSEQEPRDTCQRVGNIIGTVDSVRRGALVRQVPSAEEPAESAVKKRQCERNHRSKERDECTTRALAEEGESPEWNKNDSTIQPEEGQLGRTSVVFERMPV